MQIVAMIFWAIVGFVIVSCLWVMGISLLGFFTLMFLDWIAPKAMFVLQLMVVTAAVIAASLGVDRFLTHMGWKRDIDLL